MTAACWQLGAHARDHIIVVDLSLLDVEGDAVPWHLALPVTIGQPREAQTCARLVAAASGGAISRGRVLRRISHAEQHAEDRVRRRRAA